MTEFNTVSGKLAPSSGNASSFSMDWTVFVEYVIDVTVEAYEMMYLQRQLDRSWHEEQLNAIFAEDYIEYVANSHPGPHLMVTTEPRVVKESMKQGTEHIRKARKIDVKIFGSWQRDYRTRYFAWECKKIADRQFDSNLVYEYVTEGIHRFCDGEYSNDVETAGMLGYVLSGEIESIVEEINDSLTNPIRNRSLPASERLLLGSSRRSLEHVYESSHGRSSKSTIKLHHLFLTINWLANEPEDPTQIPA